jgi:hypothetical protein
MSNATLVAATAYVGIRAVRSTGALRCRLALLVGNHPNDGKHVIGHGLRS